LLPASEVNDWQWGGRKCPCPATRLLSSNDAHLRGIDFRPPALTTKLQSFDLTAPVIATPAEVGAKSFFPALDQGVETGENALFASHFEFRRHYPRP